MHFVCHLFAAFCTSQRAAEKDMGHKKMGKKTRNLFSFYANQITHKQQFLLPLAVAAFRAAFERFQFKFRLANKFADHKCVLSACQQFVRAF